MTAVHRVVGGVLERVWCTVNELMIIVTIARVLMLLVTWGLGWVKSSVAGCCLSRAMQGLDVFAQRGEALGVVTWEGTLTSVNVIIPTPVQRGV